MPRPKKAVVDYFPHFVNHKRTIFTIESKFGNNGYAFWFKVLELLGSTEQHFIDCRDVEEWEFILAKTLVDSELAIEILDLLSKLGAIDKELWSYKIIWSANFVENLSSVYKRRDVNVYTREDILNYCIQKPQSEGVNSSETTSEEGFKATLIPKVKESKVKESKVKDIKSEIIKNLFGEKVLLSDQEYQKLVSQHGEQETKQMISILDSWYLTKGNKPNKSDYHTMVGSGWVLKRFMEDRKRQRNKDPGDKPPPPSKTPKNKYDKFYL